MTRPLLLSVIELGGYPDFTPLYRQAGYAVLRETRMRKAIRISATAPVHWNR